jgi:hypothetical protein
MTTIYLLMVLSPLAPLAMQSKRVAHAVTGECSGDCQIDGCSLEHSAAHACCCWQKKLKETVVHADEHAMLPVVKIKKGAKSCCAPSQPAGLNHDSSASSETTRKETVKTTTIGTAPCGSKLFAWLGTGKMLHLPYVFSGGISVPLEGYFSAQVPDKLTSRSVEPPHPPPKISFFS